jgi:hypothetical protein
MRRRAPHAAKFKLKQTALTLISLVAVVACAWLLIQWLTVIPDLAAVMRVKPGMTEAQVTGIFGARPTATAPYQFNLPNRTRNGRERYWHCDAGIVEVHFDEQGKVQYASHLSHDFQPNPTTLKVKSFLRSIGLGWLVW